MPYGEQKSLSDDEVYAVTGYTLFLNGIVEENAVITQASLPAIKMPNQSGFLWSLEATKLTDSE
jgi:cytochrome c